MKGFYNKAELRQNDDGKTWELMADLFYDTGNEVIKVPEGFNTDLASIPRLFWNILPPFGKYTNAAVVHDWLYRNHIGTRESADKILLQAMIDSGVGWFKRQLIYRHVRWYGWIAWNDDARALRKAAVSVDSNHQTQKQ